MRNIIDKKSSAKTAGLANPEETAHNKLRRVFNVIVPPYFFIAGIFVALALFEWHRSIFSTHKYPWLLTIAALLALGICAYKIRQVLPSINNNRQDAENKKVENH